MCGLPPASSLAIHYRPDLGLLTARWMADSDLPTLQAEYEAILDTGRHHRSTRWLLDVRRREVPTMEAAAWVAGHWLPLAAAAVAPSHLQLAYLISPLRAETLRTDPALQATAEQALQATAPYDLRLFGDEGEAVRWLTS